MKAVTTDSFDAEVTNSITPVLVDFWAPWCGPCKAFMPTLEKLEKEYEGKMKFVKLDVSESRDFGNIVLNGLAIRDLVNSVPYILMVRKGRIVESFPHVATPIILRAAIDKVVA